MRLIHVAQRASDLGRASAFYLAYPISGPLLKNSAPPGQGAYGNRDSRRRAR
jgi:hypothetical protein